MTTPHLGEIRIVAFGFAPGEWATCDGQIMSIAQNTALFALLGTQYGGDGVTTFALPDFRGRVPMHRGPTHFQGESAGENQVSLSLTQVPEHTQALMASTAPATGATTDPTSRFLSRATTEVYTDAAADTSLSAASVPIGSAVTLPHSNIQPYLVLNFMIALAGIFPSQN